MILESLDLPNLISDALESAEAVGDLTLCQAVRVYDDAEGTYTETVTEVPCRGLITAYPASWRAGGLVEANDRQAIILAISLKGTVPRLGDTLSDGSNWAVVSEAELDTTGSTYSLQVRR